MSTIVKHTILLTRHFPTQEDVADSYSAPNSGLSPLPVDPAQLTYLRSEVSAFCSRADIRRVLCADNRRCRDTVKALFPADFAVVPTPLLFNVHIPEWVGLSEEAAETQYSALYNQWYNDPDGVIFSNGDSLHKLRDRLQRLFASVDEACAVVTHTTPFQLLVCDALGLELAGVWRFKPEFYSFAVIGPQIVWGLNASSLQAITLRL